MLLRCPYLAVLLLLFSPAAPAQFSPYKLTSNEFELEAVPIKSNEDFGHFNDAVEDREHFIWLSGIKGLNVFDGQRLVSYSAQSTEHILATKATRINFRTTGRDLADALYMQELNGHSVVCFDPMSRKLRYEVRLPAGQSEWLHSLSASSGNDLLALTVDSGYSRYYLYRLLPFTQRRLLYSGTYHNQTDQGLCFAAGYYWLMDRSQVVRISPGDNRTSRYRFPDSNAFSCKMYVDADRVFFLSDPSNVIYTWDARSDRLITYMPQIPALKGKYLKFAVRGDTVYLGWNSSLYIINTADSSIQDYSMEVVGALSDTRPVALSQNLVSILPTGGNGVFYILQKNIYRLKKKLPSRESFLERIKGRSDELPALSYRQLTEDEQGNIYASFYHGIVWKPRGSADFTLLPAAMPVTPLVRSTYGLHYWKGHLLWNNVLLDLRTGAYRFLDSTSYASHATQYLRTDTLWFYVWAYPRICRYNLRTGQAEGVIVDKLDTHDERFEEINDMFVDTAGNVWLATQWNGIVMSRGRGRPTKKYSFDELSLEDAYSPSVYCLFPGREGVWFGCADGLGLLQPGSGKATIYRNPHNSEGTLKKRAVFSLLPDSAGNFYLGSNAGLVYFNRKDRVFHNLPQNHPLENVEFNRASAFHASDNRYYFGATDALYSFLPSELSFVESSEPISPVKVYNVSIFNSRKGKYRYLGALTGPDPKLRLGPFDNRVELEVSVPEFDKDVYYSYRIAGKNGEWSDYRLMNRISLYSLSPGDYILEIKASTSLSDDHARYYRVFLEVQQVWYKRGWVLLLFCLGVLAAGWLMIRSRFNQKLKRQRDLETLRTKISIDLHDDVGSTLSGLAMQSEMLAYTADGEQKDTFKEINSLSRDAMEQMRDIVWSMDSRKDKYENLIDRMRAFAEKHLGINNITHEFNVRVAHGNSFIDPEKRQAVYLIFKEAVTNITRHSNASHVVIEFVQHKKQMQLLIQDNGCRPPAKVSDGMGLSNMKMRAEKIGGKLTAEYRDGFVVELLLH